MYVSKTFLYDNLCLIITLRGIVPLEEGCQGIFRNNLTRGLRNRYTEIPSLQTQIACFVETYSLETCRLHTSSLLPFIYKKKALLCHYQSDRTIDIAYKHPTSIKRLPCGPLCRGLGDFPLSAPFLVRLTNKIRDGDLLNGAIRHIMPIQLKVLIKVEVIRENKEKVFNEHKEERYESDSRGDTQPPLEGRFKINYLWSYNVITVFKAYHTKGTQPIQEVSRSIHEH